MAAKKSSKAINKSAFVRSLPSSMSAADVVTAAKAKGITLSEKYVHTIRYNAKTAARKKGPSAPIAAGVRRGPGRPPRAASAGASHGLVGEIEKIVNRIVDQRVAEILKAKLGAMLG